MSEAWGVISIKTNPELAAKFDDSESVPWAAMVGLYEASGLQIDKFIDYGSGEPFFHEGIKVDGDLVVVSIFGSEWMDALKPIINEGSGVEIYGKIAHEYGYNEYYILDAEGTRFFDYVDYEGDEDKDEDAIIEKWKALIPADIIKRSTID